MTAPKSSGNGAAVSTFCRTAGVTKSSVKLKATAPAATATHRNRTLFLVFQALPIIQAVFCHRL